MCYICNCFAWGLDVLQRLVTFMLACVLSCVVCVGLAVAIAAGVAYGYNYSMAEWLTFTRQDVTVYMRRGQFYDKLDVDLDRQMMGRRSGGDENPLDMNRTLDYPDQKPASANSLPESFDHVKDTRKYAELLSKYSGSKLTDDIQLNKPIEASSLNPPSPPTSAPQRLVPTEARFAAVHTTIIESGASQIIMRKFQTVEPMRAPAVTQRVANEYFYQDLGNVEVDRKTLPSPPIGVEKIIPRIQKGMREWAANPLKTSNPEDMEEIDEDPIVYRPVEGMRHWASDDVKTSNPEYAEEIDEDTVVYKPV